MSYIYIEKKVFLVVNYLWPDFCSEVSECPTSCIHVKVVQSDLSPFVNSWQYLSEADKILSMHF